MIRALLILLAIVMLVAVVLTILWGTRAGYESAPYEVDRIEGNFELRKYPAMTVVETGMGDSKNGADGSFSRLFRFITGGNTAKQKISMTTPVLMLEAETGRKMAFVLPWNLTAPDAPAPFDAKVSVTELPAGQFAVLRFQGDQSPENEKEALQRLRDWMRKNGLQGTLPPVYAYFDPPWTPVIFRRNEVMLRVEGCDQITGGAMVP